MNDPETENKALTTRLGYGVLDLEVGNWSASNDVAGYSYVRHPEFDDKFCARELLNLLGKRFATYEAQVMWQQIEQYRDLQATLYGPPGEAVGRPSLKQAAQEWYSIFGLRFEKAWYLQVPLEVHYARAGRERVRGRWLRVLHPELRYFVEAGFSSGEILSAFSHNCGGGWRKILRRLWEADRRELTRFWLELAAYLMDFPVEIARLDVALAEVTAHAIRLSQKAGYPVEAAAATLDYLRRLQLGGLGPEVIGLEV